MPPICLVIFLISLFGVNCQYYMRAPAPQTMGGGGGFPGSNSGLASSNGGPAGSNGGPAGSNVGPAGSNGGLAGGNGGPAGSNGGLTGSNGGYAGSNGGLAGSNGGFAGSGGGYPGSSGGFVPPNGSPSNGLSGSGMAALGAILGSMMQSKGLGPMMSANTGGMMPTMSLTDQDGRPMDPSMMNTVLSMLSQNMAGMNPRPQRRKRHLNIINPFVVALRKW